MIVKKMFFLSIFLLLAFQSLCAQPLDEQFKQAGYAEICNDVHTSAETFNSLYAHFDELIEFLQACPLWKQKLYSAKERFIRSKERNHYSSDFFGFYDDSNRAGKNQISFYYSTHFHEFICSHYPEFSQVPEITCFFNACFEVQNACGKIFAEAANELDLETIFSSPDNHPPILFKIIKYFPSYAATKPHYDGTAFSLFLHSTDNQSLLLSPYKSAFTIADFSPPARINSNSWLLIPGALLEEFSIFPTPHIVVQSGKVRYAAIAFAMRPDFIPKKIELSPLPLFNR